MKWCLFQNQLFYEDSSQFVIRLVHANRPSVLFHKVSVVYPSDIKYQILREFCVFITNTNVELSAKDMRAIPRALVVLQT